jgi:hypothetical protein
MDAIAERVFDTLVDTNKIYVSMKGISKNSKFQIKYFFCFQKFGVFFFIDSYYLLFYL